MLALMQTRWSAVKLLTVIFRATTKKKTKHTYNKIKNKRIKMVR